MHWQLGPELVFRRLYYIYFFLFLSSSSSTTSTTTRLRGEKKLIHFTFSTRWHYETSFLHSISLEWVISCEWFTFCNSTCRSGRPNTHAWPPSCFIPLSSPCLLVMVPSPPSLIYPPPPTYTPVWKVIETKKTFRKKYTSHSVAVYSLSCLYIVTTSSLSMPSCFLIINNISIPRNTTLPPQPIRPSHSLPHPHCKAICVCMYVCLFVRWCLLRSSCIHLIGTSFVVNSV